MKKRIGRRQLTENLRMMRRQREDAILRQRIAEEEAGRLREENQRWRDRLEKLENDPDLQSIGAIPNGTLIQPVRIDFSMVKRIRNDKESRELIRRELARKLAEEIVNQGLMRVQYGGEEDPYNTRIDPYGTVRIIARLDVVPWDMMVRRVVNGIILEPRRFYEERLVPPVYEDMARNEELAQDAPAPWELIKK